jgi:hypothetical protein
VDGVGEHLLADAGLADKQDLGVGRGEAAQLRRGDGDAGRRRGQRRERLRRVLLQGVQLGRGDDAEHQHLRSQEQHGAVAQRRRAFGAAAVDERAVGAAQILNDEQVGAARRPLHARVRARHRRVGDHQRRLHAAVARRRAAADLQRQVLHHHAARRAQRLGRGAAAHDDQQADARGFARQATARDGPADIVFVVFVCRHLGSSAPES